MRQISHLLLQLLLELSQGMNSCMLRRPFPIHVKKSHMTIKVEEYIQGKRVEPAAKEEE